MKICWWFFLVVLFCCAARSLRFRSSYSVSKWSSLMHRTQGYVSQDCLIDLFMCVCVSRFKSINRWTGLFIRWNGAMVIASGPPYVYMCVWMCQVLCIESVFLFVNTYEYIVLYCVDQAAGWTPGGRAHTVVVFVCVWVWNDYHINKSTHMSVYVHWDILKRDIARRFDLCARKWRDIHMNNT